MNKNKINVKLNKKILCVVIIFAVFASVILTSCDKPAIYTAVENLLHSKNDNSSYILDFDLNIKINKDYLYKAGILYEFDDTQFDTVPDELTVRFCVNVQNSKSKICEFAGYAKLNDELKTNIYCQNNRLYIELNDMSKVIVDLLFSTGFVDMSVKNIFNGLVSYDTGTFLCFDLSDFNLSWFDKYSDQIGKTFKVTSTEQKNDTATFSLPDFTKAKILYFNDIKSKTEKELLKLPYYRYAELYIVLSEENKTSYINVLATRENGKTEQLDKVKIDYDISKIKNNPQLLYSDTCLPMRYMLELLGETVEWDSAVKKAFTLSNGKKLYYDGTLINSKTYISLVQILANTSYGVQTGTSGDYIEFIIFRK